MTTEDLQQHLNLLDTKQIIRKLVALRRKELEDKKTANMYHMRTQLKVMKEQITALKRNVSSLRCSALPRTTFPQIGRQHRLTSCRRLIICR